MTDKTTHTYTVELTEEQAQAYVRRWLPRPPAGHASLSWQADYAIADAIRAQMPKPKPPEPTLFGAVVRDKRGVLWSRADNDGIPWFSIGANFVDYACVDAVEVVFPGVEA